MPELPPPKRQPVLEPEVVRLPADAGVAYAELHCRTNFSFLEGASHPDELVRQAAGLGYRALAITDRNSLAGVVRAHIAAKEVGLPLVIGAEITPTDAPPVVLWATDRASYGRLCRLITRGRRNAPKGECALTLSDVAEFSEGLIAGVLTGRQPLAPPGVSIREDNDNQTSDCTLRIAHCELNIAQPQPPAEPGADNLLIYREIFEDRCYLLTELV